MTQDLFGYQPAQGSLFGDAEDRMATPVRDNTPSPDRVRERMTGLLISLQNADKMPLSDRDIRMWKTIFPNMATWLPDDEGKQLVIAFDREMDRLKKSI